MNDLRKVVKPKRNTDNDLIQGWSKQYRRPVSIDEVCEINANLSSFIDVMERIDLFLSRKHKRENPLSEDNSAYNKAA